MLKTIIHAPLSRILYLTASLCLLGGCGGKSDTKASPLTGKAAGRNLLLVTLDTTRADRIGCYGYSAAATPTIDNLAKRGALFESAYCQAPLTLVSHTSMMTGLYPKEHGIRDNGKSAIDPARPTLAKAFKASGYHTAAFVASYVLDARFGLNAGFDTYDDDMGKVELGAQLVERQRPANVVTDRALAWLDTNKAGPFFCWVHYYDPHEPYEPPPEFRKAHPKAYDGEVAFMDSQLKRIVDWLAAQKLTDKTTIVVVGDHGEAFGEHGEKGHAMFLYEINLHVPLIFVDPAVAAGKRIASLVEVTDIFPTISDLFGKAPPQKISARCLSPALAGQTMPDQDCYSESHTLFNSHGYAEQRSLTTRQWKLISSTLPELYDRKADPDELNNVIKQHQDVTKQLLNRLLDRFDSWTPGQPRTVQQSQQSIQALAALGYVSGGSKTSTEFLTPNLPDPKQMLPVVLQMQEANSLIHTNKVAEAIPLLLDAKEKSPKSFSIFYTLGTAYLQLGKFEDAIQTLAEGLKLETKHAPMLVSMGDALAQSGKHEQALQHYTASLGIDDTNPVVYYKMAQACTKLGRGTDAITHLRKSISLRPDFPEALNDLAYQLGEQGSFDEAIKVYRESVRAKPADASAHYNLGVMLSKANRLSDAATELTEAVRLKPDYGEALVDLGISLGMQGKFEEATRALESAARSSTVAAKAEFNLGATFERMQRPDQAVLHYEKVFEIEPTHNAAIEAIYRIHLHNHNMKEVVRILRRATNSMPENLKFTNMLASVLSTTQDDSLRNGAEALELMKDACRRTNYQNPGLLGTLAAAYAETKDFDHAEETARKAIDIAKSSNQPKVVEIVAPQLDAYLKKTPYRNPKY